MLYMPITGNATLEDNVADTAAELGVSVTAGTGAHTKNATYTTLIASTAFDAYGITLMIANPAGAASTNTRALVDIAIGAASSEIVIIPNLLAGNVCSLFSGSGSLATYHFPIYIKAGIRLSATCQTLLGSNTLAVAIYLHRDPTGPGGFVGQRVTAYGADTATSSGVSHSPGNAAYAAATEIVAAAANPIKFLQIGHNLHADTTGNAARGLARIGIGATPDYIASDLPFSESTTLETVQFHYANFMLSNMRFNLPAATRLVISAMRNIAAEARGWTLYGVD